ncbi:MAG: hypothetical protein AXA67_12760 [Methylothermaceae bacteria B42]|nr:MAG: hypothetical protein AXA67_12760 [Methylothermaceae bacteria B42]
MQAAPQTNQYLEVTCNNCGFNTICFPRGLTQEEVTKLDNAVQRRKVLHKGDYLFRAGDPFHGLIAVKSGCAKLSYQDECGNEHILSLLLPGELLGFDGFSGKTYRCTAQALDTLSYCELPASQITQLCLRIPPLFKEILRHAGDALEIQREQLVFIKKTAEERVSSFLMDLSSRYGYRGFSTREFSIGFTRQELGNYLDLALATVSRTLKQFEKEGWIRLRGKKVTILDMDSLRQLSCCGKKSANV